MMISVDQVVHDGKKFRPVVGGFHSGKIKKKGDFEQQFNHSGQYKFSVCVSNLTFFAEFLRLSRYHGFNSRPSCICFVVVLLTQLYVVRCLY